MPDSECRQANKMIIDGHAHVGYGRYKSLSPDDLLRQMDEHGVDCAVICPVEEQIVVHNRAGNDFILEQIQRHPGRFVGFAVANPWYGQVAVEEVRRALGEGLRGLKFHPVIQGFSIDDPITDPLLDIAAGHRVPVYVHSGTAHFGEPFKIAEAARRHPQVTFIMGHSGASDFWSDIPRCHQFAPNILFETSRNGPANYVHLAQHVGADHLVFGTNAPESQYSLEMASIRDAIIRPPDLALVLGGNMARVLAEVAL